MSARTGLCLAAALLLAAAGTAGADSYQPSVGSAPPSSRNATAGLPAGPPAYNQAATDDPYNQPDFSNRQSFGLAASQMLGAAAACEQLHSDRISLNDRQGAKAGKDAADADRANLDAAQQYMLDPAATTPDGLRAGEVDCDRVSASFSRLQEIQLQNQSLAKDLDQPDALSPTTKRK
jgi:hypothetical protein